MPRATPARRREYAQSPAGKAVRRRYVLKRLYGLSPEAFAAMAKAQNGRCAICVLPPASNRFKDFHVDHDHNTGAVRGLLCHRCNLALGQFRDDSRLLHRALEYLAEHHVRQL